LSARRDVWRSPHGQQLFGDVLRNVADEILDESARLLPADPLFRIAMPSVTEICAIE